MKRSLLAIVAISGLLLAACGDDDDDSADTASGDTDTTEETVAPVNRERQQHPGIGPVRGRDG